jgi:hypothetical protein
MAVAVSWVPGAVLLLELMKQKTARMQAESSEGESPPIFEWRTSATLLGLPLAHIRWGEDPTLGCRPVKAWIAMGDVACGGLFAFGGIAIAPICCGGFAFGALVFGGFAAGILTYAGFGFGVWSIGGCILGLFSVGGCALGWKGTLGGIAIAREFAVGGVAVARHANDVVANAYIRRGAFFPYAYLLVTKWLWPTMLAATIPSLLSSLARRRRARRCPIN